jgi:hypothetical protein
LAIHHGLPSPSTIVVSVSLPKSNGMISLVVMDYSFKTDITYIATYGALNNCIEFVNMGLHDRDLLGHLMIRQVRTR